MNLLQLSREDLSAELKGIFNEWRDSFLSDEPTKKEKLLTPEAVQAILSISNTTLWRLQKLGKLIPVNIGGSKRFRESDVNKLIEG